MSLATKPIGSTHKSGCFILAAAPTVVYPEAEFVCDFGGLLGSTSSVEHCPPVTSHRTLLHSKLQFRLRWRSLSSPNLLLRFGKYVVWAHVAAGILECSTVIWIKNDRGSRRIVDHEGSQSDLMSSFIHSWHTDWDTGKIKPIRTNQPTNQPTKIRRWRSCDDLESFGCDLRMIISQKTQLSHQDQPHSPSLPSVCQTMPTMRPQPKCPRNALVCPAAPSVDQPHPRPHPADEGFL